MYTVMMWHDYYNEKRECRERETYRNSKSTAIEMARWSVKHGGCDRALVHETGSSKILFFVTKINGHVGTVESNVSDMKKERE